MLITPDQAHRWSQMFPEQLADLWSGIRSCAQAMDRAEADKERALATHSFLLAVGNFKRHTPIFVAPATNAPDESWEAEPEVFVWKVGTLCRDVADSWLSLDAVQGIGVPTASTVLSALWPTSHAIFDALTVQAATALRGASGHWDGPISPTEATSESPPHFERKKWISWDCYRWYRDDCILTCAESNGVSPQTIERALFQVIRWQFINDPAPPNETWDAYGQRLIRCLASLPAKH